MGLRCSLGLILLHDLEACPDRGDAVPRWIPVCARVLVSGIDGCRWVSGEEEGTRKSGAKPGNALLGRHRTPNSVASIQLNSSNPPLLIVGRQRGVAEN